MTSNKFLVVNNFGTISTVELVAGNERPYSHSVALLVVYIKLCMAWVVKENSQSFFFICEM